MTRLSEVKAERDRAARTAHIYLMALHLSQTTTPDASETVCLGDDRYRIDVYGSDRADGGIVVQRFIHPGQSDTIDAWYYDEWRQGCRDRIGLSTETSAFAVAADQLHLYLRLADLDRGEECAILTTDL